jgi:hypothetical protein
MYFMKKSARVLWESSPVGSMGAKRAGLLRLVAKQAYGERERRRRKPRDTGVTAGQTAGFVMSVPITRVGPLTRPEVPRAPIVKEHGPRANPARSWSLKKRRRLEWKRERTTRRAEQARIAAKRQRDVEVARIEELRRGRETATIDSLAPTPSRQLYDPSWRGELPRPSVKDPPDLIRLKIRFLREEVLPEREIPLAIRKAAHLQLARIGEAKKGGTITPESCVRHEFLVYLGGDVECKWCHARGTRADL